MRPKRVTRSAICSQAPCLSSRLDALRRRSNTDATQTQLEAKEEGRQAHEPNSGKLRNAGASQDTIARPGACKKKKDAGVGELHVCRRDINQGDEMALPCGDGGKKRRRQHKKGEHGSIEHGDDVGNETEKDAHRKKIKHIVDVQAACGGATAA